MKRTQIQLEEGIYQMAKDRAYSEDRSMASLIRDAVVEYLATEPASHDKAVSDFSFIGSGSSDPSDGPHPLSTRHDDILAEGF